MSNRLDTERQKELEPTRLQFAIIEIEKLGYEVAHISDSEIQFTFNGQIVALFPYSGWHTGKSIKDGRGIKNLLKQITPKPCAANTENKD